MARGFRMGGARGSAILPDFSSNGLTPQGSTIVSGGYRLNGNLCEIDIVFKTTATISQNNGIIIGFPAPKDVSAGTFFGESMANCQMYRGVNQTGIFSKASIASNTTIHFVISYAWR